MDSTLFTLGLEKGVGKSFAPKPSISPHQVPEALATQRSRAAGICFELAEYYNNRLRKADKVGHHDVLGHPALAPLCPVVPLGSKHLMCVYSSRQMLQSSFISGYGALQRGVEVV